MHPGKILFPLLGLLAAAATTTLAVAAAATAAGSVTNSPADPPLIKGVANPGGISIAPISSRAVPPPASAGSASTPPNRSLRQILPDPALLDGSKLAADKYPDYGMIGDFDLPGDDITDPAQQQRVGASNPNQSAPAAGGTPKLDPILKGPGGASSQAKAGQSGGGGAESQSQNGAQGGGQSGQAGGRSGGSSSNGVNGSSGGTGATGDTRVVGTPVIVGRVANNAAPTLANDQLMIDETAGTKEKTPVIDLSGVPVLIGVGDPNLAIKPVATPSATGVVQQTTPSTPGGAVPAGGGGSSGNRGSEKGKTMQSGL